MIINTLYLKTLSVYYLWPNVCQKTSKSSGIQTYQVCNRNNICYITKTVLSGVCFDEHVPWIGLFKEVNLVRNTVKWLKSQKWMILNNVWHVAKHSDQFWSIILCGTPILEPFNWVIHLAAFYHWSNYSLFKNSNVQY